ncbi:hypothetical protein GCM10010502_03380 [Kitasatospora aureofaciens]|uniref:Uncharacterized protein n=1 Tax=Kitasatospora aureofaciens TaxID=1894 RepID=A0A8H9LN83_KITAU|nr:hypothetical protein GCM10010502_03380 [Kitasatospora aureofaciens]
MGSRYDAQRGRRERGAEQQGEASGHAVAPIERSGWGRTHRQRQARVHVGVAVLIEGNAAGVQQSAANMTASGARAGPPSAQRG